MPNTGPFEVPSLSELRTRLALATAATEASTSSLSSLTIDGDAPPGLRFEHLCDPNGVSRLIMDRRNAGSVFQVASQVRAYRTDKLFPTTGSVGSRRPFQITL
jgi:hypothetical protein